MNAPHDPLSEMLAAHAADLPARAASAARQRNVQRRHHRQRLAQVAVLSLLGWVTWNVFPGRITPPIVAVHSPGIPNQKLSQEPDAAPLNGNALQSEKPSAGGHSLQVSLPLPGGLNEEQAEFVKAVGDAPLLFVRDASGKVTRIHFVQR
jgi:hypothetical protein